MGARSIVNLPDPQTLDPRASSGPGTNDESRRLWDAVQGALGAALLETMRQGWSVSVVRERSKWRGKLEAPGFPTIEITSGRPDSCVFFLIDAWMAQR